MIIFKIILIKFYLRAFIYYDNKRFFFNIIIELYDYHRFENII